MSHLGVDKTTERGQGRTLAMVQALPYNERATIVVHTNVMASYLRVMLQDIRPDLLSPAIRIMVVSRVRDCERLRGLRFYVDHAVWTETPVEVQHLLRAMRPLNDPRKQEPTV